mgnify:CR=1 FL=1
MQRQTHKRRYRYRRNGSVASRESQFLVCVCRFGTFSMSICCKCPGRNRQCGRGLREQAARPPRLEKLLGPTCVAKQQHPGVQATRNATELITDTAPRQIKPKFVTSNDKGSSVPRRKSAEGAIDRSRTRRNPTIQGSQLIRDASAERKFFILWRECDRLDAVHGQSRTVARAVVAVDFGGLPGKSHEYWEC